MDRIAKDFPQFEFIPANFFMWSPHELAIYYDTKRVKKNDGLIALVHEIGHATLDHRLYRFDAELLKMEMDAWDEARKLANRYGLTVDEDHISRCIKTYDDWLTKRATCPDCSNFSLQRGRDEYSCFGCGAVWQVNWRKDRRVTRKVVERYEHPILQFAEKIDHNRP